MALVKYDDFLAPHSDRGSFYYVNGADQMYPDSNQINIFGTLYLPRVYGKDLTSFEIASSGAVAITLNDIHSFDITRDNTLSNITLKTVSNDSLILSAGENSNTFFYMDAPNSNIVMTASNDMTFTAIDTMNLNADKLNFMIGDSFSILADNLNLAGRSNVYIAAQTGDIVMSSRNSNVVFTMSNDMATLSALKDIALYGDNSNISFVMQMGDASLSASSNILLNGGASLYLGATSNIYLTASNDSMYMSANNGSMLVSMDHTTDTLSFISANQIQMASSNQISLTSANDSVLLKAAGENVYVKLRSDTSNLEMYAISNVTVTADQKLLMTSSNEASITAGDTISMYTSNNMIVSACNAFTLTASNDINVETQSGSLTLSANGGLAYAAFDASTNSLTIGTSNNILMTASNDYSVMALSDVSLEAVSGSLNLSANGGKAYASFDAATNSLYVGTSNDITITASNDVTISTLNNYSVNTVNHVSFTSTSGDLMLSASKNFTVGATDVGVMASSNILLGATDNVNVTGGYVATMASSNLLLSGSNYVKMYTSQNQIIMDNTQSNIVMAVGVNPEIIKIYEDRVQINGNIQVTGTIDTIDIAQTNLQVADKTISLAFDSNNGPLPDGPDTNSGAGIRIAGQYGGTNARSILWNWNQGMQHLGTSNIDNESFWDIRGGQLRISHSNAEKEVAFGFRINDKDELEIVKKTGAGTFKRIAKFGRTFI